jgi:hypothetical protein
MQEIQSQAAFDMLQPGLLIDRISNHPPFRVCLIIKDFLIDWTFRVKVGSCISSKFDMKVGCGQGSTLGPRLFSVYCGGLRDIIPHSFVTYADNAHVMISGMDIDELKDRGWKIDKKSQQL